jgi:hypothetical protein
MRNNRVEGTRAFLQGIYGIGPEKAKSVSWALGPNAMQRLMRDPMTLAEALGSSKHSYAKLPSTIKHGVDCMDLWADLIQGITTPASIAEVPALTGCDTSGPQMFTNMDCLIGLGMRLRQSLHPDEGRLERINREGALWYRFLYRGPMMQHDVKGWFGQGHLILSPDPAIEEWPWAIYSGSTNWAR